MLYDTIVIGAGPAGLTASIYASRYKLTNLVIGKIPGGTIVYAHKVENYPGVPDVSGAELGQKMIEQARALGGEILGENVAKILKGPSFVPMSIGTSAGKQEVFKVITESGKEFEAKTLIVASGTERRKLGIPGEKEYLNRGVSYCTNCDAPFFKGKTVVLVGGANAACSGAVHLAEYAHKVYLIYRKSELRAEPVWVQEVKSNPKIEVIYETNLVRILGAKEVGGVGPARNASKLTCVAGGEIRDVVGGVELDKPLNGEKILKTDGVFVEIGGIPASDFLVSFGVQTDENGYIKVNEEMATNVAGLFAAGDVTDRSLFLQQTVTACADGAKAAASTFKYLKSR